MAAALSLWQETCPEAGASGDAARLAHGAAVGCEGIWGLFWQKGSLGGVQHVSSKTTTPAQQAVGYRRQSRRMLCLLEAVSDVEM